MDPHHLSTVSFVRVLVVGGAGMLGVKLAERLAHDRVLAEKSIVRLTLVDVVESIGSATESFAVDKVVADIAAPGVSDELVADRPDVIFHLAAVVSAAAEADLEAGYRTNLDGTRALLDSIRSTSVTATALVSSSHVVDCSLWIAVSAADRRRPGLTPVTSYGTQKAIGELLLSDYSRRRFLDGIGIRMPTICVRPGAPNRAASGFFSSIIREPLNGKEAVLPVPDSARHWHASPRAAVGFLATPPRSTRQLSEDRRCLTMPGVSVTVGDQIEALRRVGGDEVVRLIRREPDEATCAWSPAGRPLRHATRPSSDSGRNELRGDRARARRGRDRRRDPWSTA